MNHPNQLNQSEKSTQEQLIGGYDRLNKARLNYEADGRALADRLKELLLADVTDQSQEEINKLTQYFESDETSLANIEYGMSSLEQSLGYDVDSSKLYDDSENDVLVNSAIFYDQRVAALREKISDPKVDAAFVDAVVGYAYALEKDALGVSSLTYYDDVTSRQEAMQQAQIRRSEAHNRMIGELNNLNSLSRKNGLKPLMYRDLAKNSRADGYKNDRQMYHDRISAARYAALVTRLASDSRLPSSSNLERT